MQGIEAKLTGERVVTRDAVRRRCVIVNGKTSDEFLVTFDSLFERPEQFRALRVILKLGNNEIARSCLAPNDLAGEFKDRTSR
jgi:hypothetical protein